ncbi:peroxiredoxin family protein [Candidatus Kuenenbacteria bacterium]|nr:peroxiredoxin family protein [Candidatus Kuenenbacteria bacterium]
MRTFTLQNNDNTDLNFEEYQGQNFLLLVFFRGAWCNHCKKQLVDINNQLEEFEKLGIKLLAISSDTKFKSSLLKTFLKLKFPVLSDEKFEVIDYLKLRTTYTIEGDKEIEVSKPAVMLIDPETHDAIYEYVGTDFDDRLSAKTTLENINKLLTKKV